METSHQRLKADCRGIPLHALNMSVRNKIASYLDPEGFVTGDYSNDYTGLAECIGFGFQDIKRFERQRKPTLEVLYEWGTKPELSPTVDNLINHLETIGRAGDVLSECENFIRKDVKRFRDCHKDFEPDQIQDPRVSSGSQSTTVENDRLPPPDPILTLNDVTMAGIAEGADMMYYDAFVIYNPVGRDLDFVKEMAEKLESPQYNLKLFIPWRDDLPGTSRYEISAELIKNRCKRAVVILSKEFLQSAAADFQLKFAHCLSPGARSKKVVPVFTGPCPMPNILRAVSFVDFMNPGLRDWNWPRLAAVLKCPLNPDPHQYLTPGELEKIKLNVADKGLRSWWSTAVMCMNFPEENDEENPNA